MKGRQTEIEKNLTAAHIKLQKGKASMNNEQADNAVEPQPSISVFTLQILKFSNQYDARSICLQTPELVF